MHDRWLIESFMFLGMFCNIVYVQRVNFYLEFDCLTKFQSILIQSGFCICLFQISNWKFSYGLNSCRLLECLQIHVLTEPRSDGRYRFNGLLTWWCWFWTSLLKQQKHNFKCYLKANLLLCLFQACLISSYQILARYVIKQWKIRYWPSNSTKWQGRNYINVGTM